MTGSLLVVLGLALLALTALDVFTTTFSLRGGGPVTSRLARLLWTVSLRSVRRHGALQVIGSAILPLTLVVWTAMFYAGWSLVFVGGDASVRDATTGAPASGWERVYFTGYVLSTLGNGELVPGDGAWRAATVLAALTGLAMITLALTFVTPVLSAVVKKRQTAHRIHLLGSDADEVLGRGWDGDRFGVLSSELRSLAPDLVALAQQHMAYPVLHYFHAAHPSTALAPQLLVLDDAVVLLGHGVAVDHRPDPLSLRTVEGSIDALLVALASTHIERDGRPRPIPPLDGLGHLGIPSVGDEEYERAAGHLEGRRALLAGFAAAGGWSSER